MTYFEILSMTKLFKKINLIFTGVSLSEHSPFFFLWQYWWNFFHHSALPEAAERQRDADGWRIGGRRVPALQGKHLWPGGEQLEVRRQCCLLSGLKGALGFSCGFVSLQFALDQWSAWSLQTGQSASGRRWFDRHSRSTDRWNLQLLEEKLVQ